MRKALKKLKMRMMLLAGASMFSCGLSAEVTIDTARLRRQADRFISRMTPGQQNAQREAVMAAVDGDMTALEEIRAARRPHFEVSENVDTLSIDGHILFRPRNASEKLPLLVYFHGGGWTFGSPASAARFCDAVAASGKVSVLDVDYPLAPETREEAQNKFARSMLSRAREMASYFGCDPSRVSVGGDSAGGYIALILGLMDARQQPEKIVAIYPVIDSSPSEVDESWLKYGSGYANDASLMEAFYAAWRSEGKKIPIRLDNASGEALKAFPTTLMIAAERDVLRDQGMRFADALGEAGATVERVELPGSVHLFITVPGQDEAFRFSVEKTVNFLTEN